MALHGHLLEQVILLRVYKDTPKLYQCSDATVDLGNSFL